MSSSQNGKASKSFASISKINTDTIPDPVNKKRQGLMSVILRVKKNYFIFFNGGWGREECNFFFFKLHGNSDF